MIEKKPIKKKSRSLPAQSAFLDRMIEERTPVDVFLLAGGKVRGKIESYDHFVLALDVSSAGKVYKHAISFIQPLDRDAPPVVEKPRARTAPTIEVKRRRRVIVEK
jgi:RNA chaperone Hfq